MVQSGFPVASCCPSLTDIRFSSSTFALSGPMKDKGDLPLLKGSQLYSCLHSGPRSYKQTCFHHLVFTPQTSPSVRTRSSNHVRCSWGFCRLRGGRSAYRLQGPVGHGGRTGTRTKALKTSTKGGDGHPLVETLGLTLSRN